MMPSSSDVPSSRACNSNSSVTSGSTGILYRSICPGFANRPFITLGIGSAPSMGPISSGRSLTANVTGSTGESGSATVVRRLSGATLLRSTVGFAALAAQREDAVGVRIAAHLQTIEILRLLAEAGIVDFHVIVALAREREV